MKNTPRPNDGSYIDIHRELREWRHLYEITYDPDPICMEKIKQLTNAMLNYEKYVGLHTNKIDKYPEFGKVLLYAMVVAVAVYVGMCIAWCLSCV